MVPGGYNGAAAANGNPAAANHYGAAQHPAQPPQGHDPVAAGMHAAAAAGTSDRGGPRGFSGRAGTSLTWVVARLCSIQKIWVGDPEPIQDRGYVSGSVSPVS